MGRLEEEIFEKIKTDTLVFQTQAVADSWAIAYAKQYGSVFKDRAISWDSFRDSCTDYPQDCEKADETDRRMFVSLFSKEPAFQKLKYYADFSFPESVPAYLKSIAEDLPKLCKAYDKDGQIKKDLLGKAPDELINDINIIVPKYRNFLDKNKLYEKNLCTPDFSKRADCILVFPQTFRDMEVEDAVRVCRKIDQNAPKEIYKDFAVYQNSTAEIRAALRKIRTLLNDGKTRPSDIAITCADIKKYRPYLEHEAAIRDIELDFADSQSLSILPPGRFITSFLKARKENWSFEPVKELLLNPQFPFEDKTDYAWIITSAVKLKITSGLDSWHIKLERNKEEQAWPNTQEDNINNRRGFEAFEKFENAVKTFEATVKPDNLRECFMTLCKTLFTDKQWTAQDSNEKPEGFYSKVFGSCMDELAKLEKKAALYGITDTEVLLDLYPQILESVSYQENKKTLGLKVYNYPISAGLNSKHHFVINLSDNLTRCQRDPYPFLSREALKRKEIGTEIIGSYLLQNAELSGCTDSYSGPSVMPTCFVEKGRNIKGMTQTDSFEEERKVWDGEIKAIKMPKSQKNGFDKMTQTGILYSKECAFPEVQEPMTVSISGIKDFENCPYKIFARSVLKLRETQYTMKMEDAAQIGDVLHCTIQEALKEAKKMNYLKADRLREIFKNELYVKYQSRNDAPPKIYLDHIYKTYEKILASFIDCNSLREFELLAIEGDTAYSIQLHNIIFKGRADLVLQNKDGELAVIDLKKNADSYYAVKDINKTSLQLILYAKLLEENPNFKKVPVYGAYYSFKDGKFKEVWPKTEMEILDKNLEERLCKLEAVIKDNDFSAKVSQQECKFCSFRTLCRGGYEIQ